jgi:tetraacyldisaccharide 4'-kinase
MMRPEAAIRWLWTATSPAARLARASLVPAAVVYGACARARAKAYQQGLLRSRSAGVPTVAVGNLTVGGTGKTPIASWIAARCAGLGLTPGIVLRGYGGDETQVHRERLPEAIVVEGRDRVRTAGSAVDMGARALVLDDAFQRLDLRRDLNILLISADGANAAPWTLPAGPWRESWSGIRRADLVIVTRKRADPETASRLASHVASSGVPQGRIAVAHLAFAGLTPFEAPGRVPERTSVCALYSSVPQFARKVQCAKGPDRGPQTTDLAVLRGARVLAVAGVADPESLAHQLSCLGALVSLVTYPDHHAYTESDIGRLVSAAANVDYVVTTHKDAVKLRGGWPAGGPPILVAHLEPQWEAGGGLVASLINDLLTRHYTLGMY